MTIYMYQKQQILTSNIMCKLHIKKMLLPNNSVISLDTANSNKSEESNYFESEIGSDITGV
jgi:hypothetical protein